MPPYQIVNPLVHGISLSALELWLNNRVAYELSYFRGLEAVEPWNKNTAYGTLFQAGIEGFIKTKELRSHSKFIQNEFERQIKSHGEAIDDILWWAGLAEKQGRIFLQHYSKEFNEFNFTNSEARHATIITLPSGREIKLFGYIDGENEHSFMENKCRAEWNPERIANEIDMNLQFNYYCLIWYGEREELPQTVWYQNIRRPCGFAYRGPQERKSETREQYQTRLVEYIRDNPDDHFYRFVARPNMQRFTRFLHMCLYPILEAYLDWYEYMVSPNRKDLVNKYHWMTPYGLYNPYMEGTDERFRNYALTGSTLGLRPKQRRQ